jgi:hypothetical protein
VHRVWHVVVLATTLFAVAGTAIVVLAPLLFEGRSGALDRARPVVLGLFVAAAILLVLEWLVVHGGSL